MVGFNRRFSPSVKYMMSSKEFLNFRGRRHINYQIQLGEFSISMATKNIGGGTTLGSCCHYLDLIEYVSGSEIKNYEVKKIIDSYENLVDGYSFILSCELKNNDTANLLFLRTKDTPKGVKERFMISGDGIDIEITDFEKIIINKVKIF